MGSMSTHVVTRLSVTPVKGLSLQHPSSIELTARGAVGDRRFYLVDEAGKLQSCTLNAGLFGLDATWDETTRRLAVARGGEVVVEGVVEPAERVDSDLWGMRTVTARAVADPRWGRFFSERTGRTLRLLEASDAAFDARPATLLGLASVEELARRSGSGPVDPTRFRMLVEFSGGEPHAEDTWEGRRIRVGGATLRAEGPVQRCAATTRDPASGRVDLQTLKMITAYRGRQESIWGVGANFGIYADVLEPGTVAVGDVLDVRPADED
jgi:uncharacterized protein